MGILAAIFPSFSEFSMERFIENAMYASRWLLAPIYFEFQKKRNDTRELQERARQFNQRPATPPNGQSPTNLPTE